jgi:hypothetical protein
MQSNSLSTTATPLNTYLTWCLGQDFGGFALIYATSSDEAFDLLDNYTKLAQPSYRLFSKPLQYNLLHYRPACVSSRNTDEDNYGHHIYHVGQASDETRSCVLVLDEGEDVRFND